MSINDEILSRLGRIEGKQDVQLSNQARLDRSLSAQEERLRVVEKNQSRIFGVGAGLLALWSVVAGYIKFGA